MDSAKVFAMKFSKVYPLLVQKAQRKRWMRSSAG
mgnify:CR=1 FL=1